MSNIYWWSNVSADGKWWLLYQNTMQYMDRHGKYNFSLWETTFFTLAQPASHVHWSVWIVTISYHAVWSAAVNFEILGTILIDWEGQRKHMIAMIALKCWQDTETLLSNGHSDMQELAVTYNKILTTTNFTWWRFSNAWDKLFCTVFMESNSNGVFRLQSDSTDLLST